MIKKCFSCGVEKELSKEVYYPYPEDNIDTEDPLIQLFTVECQGNNFRMTVMCHECWHRLESTIGIDMWISQRCWESLNPVRPFDSLPLVKNEDKWNPENYE